jgi:hypothetical protein
LIFRGTEKENKNAGPKGVVSYYPQVMGSGGQFKGVVRADTSSYRESGFAVHNSGTGHGDLGE